MAEDVNVARELGSLDARMANLEGRHAALEGRMYTELQSLTEAVTAIHKILAQQSGAWKALVWMTGISGVLGGAVATFFHWLARFGK